MSVNELIDTLEKEIHTRLTDKGTIHENNMRQNGEVYTTQGRAEWGARAGWFRRPTYPRPRARARGYKACRVPEPQA